MLLNQITKCECWKYLSKNCKAYWIRFNFNFHCCSSFCFFVLGCCMYLFVCLVYITHFILPIPMVAVFHAQCVSLWYANGLCLCWMSSMCVYVSAAFRLTKEALHNVTLLFTATAFTILRHPAIRHILLLWFCLLVFLSIQLQWHTARLLHVQQFLFDEGRERIRVWMWGNWKVHLGMENGAARHEDAFE